MLRRGDITRTLLGRDVAIGYVVLAVMYLVRTVEFRPLQIPAYLLIVAYDIVEVVIPVITPYHPIGFPLFLYFVAVVGASVSRSAVGTTKQDTNWRRGIGGVFVLLGLFSISFGVAIGGPIVAPADNPTPLAITGATGLAFLLAGLFLFARSS